MAALHTGLPFTLLFTLLLLGPASTSALPFTNPATLTHSGLHDPVGSVQGLITRLLGPAYLPSFALIPIPRDNATGYDVFELDSNATHVILRGNAGYSLAACFNWYIKYTVNASFTWGRRRPDGTLSGNQLSSLPEPGSPFPAPLGGPLRMVSNVSFRYAFNVVTSSYTMAFWNQSQWEEELDRMALWGVNLPLCFTAGQEATAWRFYASLGLNASVLSDFFVGPAFSAWGRMGNIQTWGGPLNQAWLASQQALTTFVVTRMRSFGMTPVLPGFAGHVPQAIADVIPGINLTVSADWAGFPSPYSPTTLLEPTDPHFVTLGATFNRMILEDYGDPTGLETPVFNADTYNEMIPSVQSDDFLKAANAAVFAAMTDADPRAIYMLQGWLFSFDNSYWTKDRVQAFLSGVPVGRLIILDLHTDNGPEWSALDGYYGHLWIWCALMIGGGQIGLFGETNRLATGPYADRLASPNMAGVGFTPEGTFVMPSQFDLVMEAGWRTEPVDPSAWYAAWALRRYGRYSPSAEAATSALLAAAFNVYYAGDSLTGYPAVGDSMSRGIDADGVLAGLRLLVAAGVQGEVDRSTGPYLFDVTDTARQVLVDLFSDAHSLLAARYAASTRANVTASVVSLAALCMQIIEDLDGVLAADPNFLLGAWLHDAASWGDGDPDPTHRAKYIFNARNQVTLWGPFSGELNDYAAKDWAGMVGGYYGVRWATLFDAMVASAAAGGAPMNGTAVDAAIYAFEQAWGANTSDAAMGSPYASGADPVALATSMLARYAPAPGANTPDPALWRAVPNTDIALPNRTNATFVQVGGADSAAVGADCPYMGQNDGVADLPDCLEACREQAQCNLVNFNAGDTACVFRLCSDPAHAQVTGGYGGWVVYGMNITGGSSPLLASLWHTDSGVLASLCGWTDSGCEGFSSRGFLLANASADTVAAEGVTLWLRRG
jgi:alpha-N-acetylglucosaminidase